MTTIKNYLSNTYKIFGLLLSFFIGCNWATAQYCGDYEPIDIEQQDIPYMIVGQKPRFKNCEFVSEKEEIKCFKEELDKHVKAHFSYPKECADMEIQGKVIVVFRITSKGDVEIIQYRGPHHLLEKKACEIILKLPQFIPAKDQGKPVNVSYAYPITFRLGEYFENNQQPQ